MIFEITFLGVFGLIVYVAHNQIKIITAREQAKINKARKSNHRAVD
jgi:hypothetical protein